MYSWATKEYLLWEMSLGQIYFYLSKGIDVRNGIKEEAPGLVNKSVEELRAMRDDIKAQMEIERREKLKEEMSYKYGDIG